MERFYPESSKLKEIIDSQGWTLFDATPKRKRNRPISWDEFEKNGPATKFEIGHNYIFARIPIKGQTLRQAYSVTKGLGPSLFIEDGTDADRWAGIELVTDFYFRGKPILFSRLGFTPEFLAVFSPKTREMPDSDILGIWYPKVIDTFEKYFRIATPKEYGIHSPIRMVHRLEDN